MSIFHLILVLVLVGALMWAINKYVPMEANIKQLLNIVVIIALVLWILFAVFPGIAAVGDIRVGR